MKGRDLVALVLTTGAALTLLAVTIGAAVSGHGISAAEGTLLGTTIGAAIGAVATYLGAGFAASSPPPRGEDRAPYDGELEGDWRPSEK